MKGETWRKIGYMAFLIFFFILGMGIGYGKGFYDGAYWTVQTGIKLIKGVGIDFTIPAEKITNLVVMAHDLLQNRQGSGSISFYGYNFTL